MATALPLFTLMNVLVEKDCILDSQSNLIGRKICIQNIIVLVHIRSIENTYI